MKKINCLLTVFLVIGIMLTSCKIRNTDSKGSRERVLDRVVSIEDELIMDIPHPPRLCDDMDIWKDYVQLDDCSLYCEIEGEGTPVVLINGGPGSTHHAFHPHFSQAGDFLKLIYYDQRGCGLSQYTSDKPYTLYQAVEDLEKMRIKLGFDKWIVLGSSFGGTLAQAYAVSFPENLSGLIFESSAFSGLPMDYAGSRQYDYISGEEMDKIREIHTSRHLSVEQIIYNAFLNGDWKRQCFYKPTRDEIARSARYEWDHDRNYRDGMLNSKETLDFSDVFSRCPIPVLIIDGKWDLTWDESKSQAFQACFNNAKLVILEEAGHEPSRDDPTNFFAELKGFVSGLKDIPDSDITAWDRSKVRFEKGFGKSIPIDIVSDEITFKTARVAPADFDKWTFFWEAPKVANLATFQYVVLRSDGTDFFRRTCKLKPGHSIRSDFVKGKVGDDPKIFYNQHVTVKFVVDMGTIKFPEDMTFYFKFGNTVVGAEIQ